MSMTGDNFVLYTPTEYEQQLLAAGWVKIEDIDPEYLAYKKRLGRYFDEWAMSHAQWLDDVRRWNQLNMEFRHEIEPILLTEGVHLTDNEQRRYEEICDEMLSIEIRLGH